MKKEKEKIIQIAVCPSNQIIVLTNQGEIYCQEKNEGSIWRYEPDERIYTR